MIKLLLHLVLVCRMNVCCYGLEQNFRNLVPNLHVENHNLGNHPMSNSYQVDMTHAHNVMEKSNRLLSTDSTKNLKRNRNSSTDLSSLSSYEKHPFKITAKTAEMERSQHDYIFNSATALYTKSINADQHWYNQIPGQNQIIQQRHPMENNAHESSSSAFVTDFQKELFDILHGSSASVSNITPDFDRDSNQDLNFSQLESQYDGDLLAKKLELVEEMLLSDVGISDREADVMPKVSFTTQENIRTSSNDLSFSLDEEVSVVDNQNLPLKKNLESYLSKILLFPKTIPAREDKILDQCRDHVGRKCGVWIQNQTFAPTEKPAWSENRAKQKKFLRKTLKTCRDIESTVFRFLKKNYNLNAEDYIPQSIQFDVKPFFPAYLLYVETIEHIVRSSTIPPEGGMKSACESFLSLAQFCVDKDRWQQDPWKQQYAFKIITANQLGFTIDVHWYFLEHWLLSSRQTLFAKIQDKGKDPFVVLRSFKNYVDSHFLLNLEGLNGT